MQFAGQIAGIPVFSRGGFDPNPTKHERKFQKLNVAAAKDGTLQQGGILFVAGLSTCGEEFKLSNLACVDWPLPKQKLLWYEWSPKKSGELAEILARNLFPMIVLADFPGRECPEFVNDRPLMSMIKSAVTVGGATLVLFSTEDSECVTRGLFGKPWKQAQYTRTTCFASPAAKAQLAAPYPKSANAKSVHLASVPAEEALYRTTAQSKNENLIPEIHAAPKAGMAAVAYGTAGGGAVMCTGDVNAEPECCKVVAALARKIFAEQSTV